MNSEPYTFSNFITREKIGSGSFGQIFKCEENSSQQEYAAKFEPLDAKIPQLDFESKLYKLFSNCTNVAKVFYYGEDEKNRIMVMQLLGKSLENYLERYKSLSLKTVLMLADQMISSLEYIHNKHFIHRDVKPDNFVMGLNNDQNKLFLIDFGLAKRYRDPKTLQHCELVKGKSLTGTARYASINALKGCEQSRRDDMEALGYVMIYLLKGKLPWMGIGVAQTENKYQAIYECKESTPIEALCEGLPEAFIEYMKMVKSLKFDEVPSYAKYRQLFRDLFMSLGFSYDYVYDWTGKPNEISRPILPLPISQSRHSQNNLIPNAQPIRRIPLGNMNKNHRRSTNLTQLLHIPKGTNFISTQGSTKVNCQSGNCEKIEIDSDSFTQQIEDLKQLFDMSSEKSSQKDTNIIEDSVDVRDYSVSNPSNDSNEIGDGNTMDTTTTSSSMTGTDSDSDSSSETFSFERTFNKIQESSAKLQS